MSSSTRRVATLAAAAMVVASVAAVGLVGPAVAQESGESSVRVVHASPDAGPVDVYVDDDLVVGNVGFGTYATTSVEAGAHTVTLTEAGNESNVVSEANVTVEAGTNYTVAASGEVSEGAATSFEQTVFVTNATAPADDEAAVRLAHLSPDAGPVDVTVNETDEVVFDNVTFRNATEYVTVPAGNYTLDVRQATATNDGEVVGTVEVPLQGGTAATAFAIGYVDPPEGDERVAFRLLLLTDAAADGAETPAATESPGTPAATESPGTSVETATPGTLGTATESTGTPAATESPAATGTDTDVGMADGDGGEDGSDDDSRY